MKQLVLQAGCDPLTANAVSAIQAANANRTGSLLGAIIRGCAVLNNTSFPLYIDIVDDSKNKHGGTDAGAVFYIVFVLVFYSAGIVIMIVKYLRREKRELEDEKTLEDFFRSMPAYKKEREQFTVNQVAIHAFHALTSLSYGGVDDEEEEVTSDEEPVRVMAPTIHEHIEDTDDDIDSMDTGSEQKEEDLYVAGLKDDTLTIDSVDVV